MKQNRFVVSFLFLCLAIPFLVTIGCGFQNHPPILSPATATVMVNDAVQFSTRPLAGGTVWSVNGQIGGSAETGTIDTNGSYIAPVVAPVTPVYVTASGATFPAQTASATVLVMNAAPRVTAIAPALVVASSAAAVVVEGEKFSPASSVAADGRSCPTRYVSSSRLEATVPMDVLQEKERVEIKVTNPAPGGGESEQPLVVIAPGTVSPTAQPLVARYDLNLPVNAAITIEFGPTTSYGRRTWTRPFIAGDSASILVAGMKANSTYHMRARIEPPAGPVLLDSDHVFTTGTLPDAKWPTISVTQPPGFSTAGGVDVLSLLPLPDKVNVTALVTDIDGSIIWFYKSDMPGFAFPLRTLDSGNLMLNYGTAVSEFDLTGKVIRQVTMDDLNTALAAAGYSIDVTQIHHDVIELANGHWILLCHENRDFQDLPGYPGTTTVFGDVLVDLDPNNEPVWVWRAFDHLDVNRHPWQFPDWTHANAIVYMPDGNLLLSLRHQSWIIKIDYANGTGTGDVLWRLGEDGDFTLDSADTQQWFYAQHFPTLVSSEGSKFRLAVYDNGDTRPLESGGMCSLESGGFDPTCYSRAVLLDVDESSRTASSSWDYQPGWFSAWGGSVVVLPNGNIELDSTSVQGGPSRVLEVTGDPDPQVVWTMDIGGALAYRAYRVPSLYPGVRW